MCPACMTLFKECLDVPVKVELLHGVWTVSVDLSVV